MNEVLNTLNVIFGGAVISVVLLIFFLARLYTRVDGVENAVNILRTDMHEGFKDLRTEFKEDMKELRAEIKDDIKDLRTELKADMKELKTEFKADMKELKSEIKEMFIELKAENSILIESLHSIKVDIEDFKRKRVS